MSKAGKGEARAKNAHSKAWVDKVVGGNGVLAWVLRWPHWLVPIAVAALGPLVLESTFLLYRALGWPEAGLERNLWYFWSATYGDLFLLPLIAWLIALAYADLAGSGVEIRRSWWTRWLAILWAVGSTTLLTVGWLRSAANANWTQPAGAGLLGLPLHLNLAGWVHAAFFVLMQWWFAEFTIRLAIALGALVRKKSAVDWHPVAVLRLTVKVNAMMVIAIGFGLLLVRDYWPDIVELPLKQTWTWFIAPVGAFVLAGVLDAVMLGWLKRRSWNAVSGSLEPLRDQLVWLASVWLAPALIAALAALFLGTLPLFGAVGWMVLAPLALAILAAVNVWAETYWFQVRAAGVFGWVVVVSVGLVMAAGFVVSLGMVARMGQVTHLQGITWPWLGAFLVDVLGCVVAIGLAVTLVRYEALSTEYHQRLRGRECWGQESPEHDIIQNLSQYGLLHALLPMFVVAYQLLGMPLLDGLDPGTHIALLFGYSGVVVSVVVFPLYNNMEHVRDLEAQTKELEQGGEDTPMREAHLSADKNFTTGQTVAVGVIAALVAMSLWVNVVDTVAEKARVEKANESSALSIGGQK